MIGWYWLTSEVEVETCTVRTLGSRIVTEYHSESYVGWDDAQLGFEPSGTFASSQPPAPKPGPIG